MMVRLTFNLILLSVVSADDSNEDSSGLLQLKTKSTKQKGTDPESPAVCKVVGDPHVTTWDEATVDCFAPGDYFLINSDTLKVEARYMGPGEGAVVGATSVYGLTISGDMVGGVINMPSLSLPTEPDFRASSWKIHNYPLEEHNIYKVCANIPKGSLHRGAYFFPDDTPCEPVDLDAHVSGGYEAWRKQCLAVDHTQNAAGCQYDCCTIDPNACKRYLKNQGESEDVQEEKCKHSGWYNSNWTHDINFEQFDMHRGHGPDPWRFSSTCRPELPAWETCGRERYTVFDFTFKNGVRIVVDQGHRQGIAIVVPNKALLGSSETLSGHCGNWDGNKTNDGVVGVTGKQKRMLVALSCPNRLFTTPMEQHTAIQALEDTKPIVPSKEVLPPGVEPLVVEKPGQTPHSFEEVAPVLTVLQESNPQEWAMGEVNDCMGGNPAKAAEANYICSRFYADDMERRAICNVDCCEERSQCPDRENGDAVKVCLAYGDPHIKPFDSEGPSRHVFYNHGDYWLYRSDVLKIQARYAASGRSAKKKRKKANTKAVITGLVLTGPLVGEAKVDGTYPIIEVQTLGNDDLVLLDDKSIVAGSCSRGAACDYADSSGFFNLSYGKGNMVRKYFEKDCEVDMDIIDATLGILQSNSDTVLNGTSGWTVCKQTFDKTGATVTRKNKKLTADTLTMDFWAGGLNDKSPLATIVVNNGKVGQQVLITLNTVMVDPAFAGRTAGHCGNADGIVQDMERSGRKNSNDPDRAQEIDPESVVSAEQSLFSKPHPSLGFNPEVVDANIPLVEFSKILLELRTEASIVVPPAEYNDYAIFAQGRVDGEGGLNIQQQYVKEKLRQESLTKCVQGGKTETECEEEFVRREYESYKYQKTCQLEHPGLSLAEGETYSEVIENCVEDCEEAGRCPAEDDEEAWEAPQQPCPHPNTETAFQACSFWGDPHFQAHFVKGRTIDYSQYLHSRGRGKPNARNTGVQGYNNFNLGLQRLFRTTSEDTGTVIEAQAFFCDARGRTTSAAGVALRIGARTVSMLRPTSTGNKAYNSAELRGTWNGSFGLDLALDGETVPWESLGTDTTGLSSNVKPEDQVFHQLQKNKWWAQQMSLDRHDAHKSYKPMCVGDADRRVMLKASVPRVHGIYEPVVTIEMDNDFVKTLEDKGLCMGPEAATENGKPVLSDSDLTYQESLFTVPELYQLCSVCDMLGEGSGGQTNAEDTQGWETSPGAKGCIHPAPMDKYLTGRDICADRHNLEAAEQFCKEAGVIEESWFDSCLAEFCNADDDVTGVHQEAKDAVSNLKTVYAETAELQVEEALEFGE